MRSMTVKMINIAKHFQDDQQSLKLVNDRARVQTRRHKTSIFKLTNTHMVAENQVIGPLGLKRWSVINTHSRMGGSILLNCASVGVGGWEFLPFAL